MDTKTAKREDIFFSLIRNFRKAFLQVLCLHLKRFRWNNTHFRTKIDADIAFPTTALDMSQFVLSNLHETRQSGAGTNLYDLAAVIVHHGSG